MLFSRGGFGGNDIFGELVRSGAVAVLQASTVGVHKGDKPGYNALCAATKRGGELAACGRMPGREHVEEGEQPVQPQAVLRC